MPARSAFDYAVVRVVPRVEREEFVNVGVVVHAPALAFLGCAIALDRARLARLFPGLSAADLDHVASHLEAWRAVCHGDAAAGPIGALSASERFHWLVAPRSTMLQTSPVHAGVTDDPAAALARLFETLVANGADPGGFSMSPGEVECPFCGEPGEIAEDYDPSEPGDQVFVQDCEVCCHPWTVTVHVGHDGEVTFDVGRG